MPLGYFQVFFGEDRVPSEEVLGVGPISADLVRGRKKISSLKINWDGITDLTLLDSPLLEENILLHWRFMFDNGHTLAGAYIVKKFSRSYPEDLSVKISLEALSRKVTLKEMPTTEVFIDVRASDMAYIAAERLGLIPNITDSKVVYGWVTMAGQTFGEVLTTMANDEDFEFFIFGDEFVFAPAPDEPDRVKELNYATEGFRDLIGMRLKNFKVDREAVARVGGERRKVESTKDDGEKVESEGLLSGLFGDIEDRNKVVYSSGGNEISAELSPEQKAAILQSQATTSATIAAAMTETSPNRGKRHATARNKSQAKFIRWRGYKISGNLVGGFLSPREFIRIKGVVGKDAGPWMVDSVTTKWSGHDIGVSFSGIAEPKKRAKAGKSKGTDDKKDDATKGEGVKVDLRSNVEYKNGGGNKLSDESKEAALGRVLVNDAVSRSKALQESIAKKKSK